MSCQNITSLRRLATEPDMTVREVLFVRDNDLRVHAM